MRKKKKKRHMRMSSQVKPVLGFPELCIQRDNNTATTNLRHPTCIDLIREA